MKIGLQAEDVAALDAESPEPEGVKLDESGCVILQRAKKNGLKFHRMSIFHNHYRNKIYCHKLHCDLFSRINPISVSVHYHRKHSH